MDARPLITIDFLMKKLSPMAIPARVEEVRGLMSKLDLSDLRRTYRGRDCIVFSYAQIWVRLYPGRKFNIIHGRDLGHSLTALFWERSALNGTFVFVKDVEEYEQWGF